MARSTPRSASVRSEITATKKEKPAKLTYDERGLWIRKVGKETTDEFILRVTKIPIAMTKEERLTENNPFRPDKKSDSVSVQSPLLSKFVNDPNDPRSLSSVAKLIQNDENESLYYFTQDGQQFAGFKGDKNSVRANFSGSQENEFFKAQGISIHNHPTQDLTFSPPDIASYIRSNQEEMIVVSPNYAYSLRRDPKSTKQIERGVGFSALGDLKFYLTEKGENIARDFYSKMYNEKEILATKKLLMQYGVNRKDPVTGVSTRKYGDEGVEPSPYTVMRMHYEICVKDVAKKNGFIYTKYSIPNPKKNEQKQTTKQPAE